MNNYANVYKLRIKHNGKGSIERLGLFCCSGSGTGLETERKAEAELAQGSAAEAA